MYVQHHNRSRQAHSIRSRLWLSAILPSLLLLLYLRYSIAVRRRNPSHLCLDISMKLFQRLHIRRRSRPPDSKSLGLIRFGDHMEVDMVDFLMCQPAVVLQHIVVLGPASSCNLLDHWQDLGQGIVGNVCELRAVVFRDDELNTTSQRNDWIDTSRESEDSYGMSFAQRLNVKKSKDPLGLEELEGGNVTCPRQLNYSLLEYPSLTYL